MAAKSKIVANGVPPDCTQCAIGRLSVYAPTLAEDPAGIARLRKEVRFHPAERTLLRESAEPREVFAIYSGWAYTFKTLPDGGRQIITFCVPGDLVYFESILLPGRPAGYGMRSLTRLVTCAFEVASVQAFFADSTPAQRERYRDVVHCYHDLLTQKIAALGRSSARSRLAQLVFEMDRRLRARGMSDGTHFPFPATQAHLADALGVTTVYVGRTLADLRDQRIFVLENGTATILDHEALHTISRDR
jgi:CRP-like cAMP-binding protein